MSIGSLGIVGSLAGAPLAGKTSDADKAREASANQQRQVHADAQAENAAGIGQTQEDSAANDRDADGRQPYTYGLDQKPAENSTEEPVPEEPPRVVDPTGEAGTRLDLTG